MYLSDRVTQLYPQAPGSLSVALYDSQGGSECFVTLLDMGNLNEHIGFQLKGIVNILFCEKW
jgi:hypothetical protein